MYPVVMRPLAALLVALMHGTEAVIQVAGVKSATERPETVNNTMPSTNILNNTTNPPQVPDSKVSPAT